MTNPLDVLLRPPPPPGSHYRWGYITSELPLQVTLDTETEPIYNPSTLVEVGVGDRVFVLLENRRTTILGKTGGYTPPEWQAWTPVIEGATTDPTMGNSTVVGRYMQIGKTVTVNAYFLFGSTFSPGSGAYSIPVLPVAPRTDYWQSLQVAANLTSPSPGDYSGHAKIEGSSGVARIHLYPGGTAVGMSPLSSSFAPANGDRLIISGTYEGA